MNLDELIISEDLHIKRLDELVRDAVREEQLLSSKLIELEIEGDLTSGERMADKVADFGGSWKFIIYFATFILVWIMLNVLWVASQRFDPYPFIFLNLILSCLAALQAPVIMMSQTRQEDKDRRRARSDYMINLKSEMEIRGLHAKLDLLLAEEMKTLFEFQHSQLELLKDIQSKLNQREFT